jgi:hypothetical protein
VIGEFSLVFLEERTTEFRLPWVGSGGHKLEILKSGKIEPNKIYYL